MSTSALGYLTGAAVMIVAIGYIVGFVTFKLSKKKTASLVAALVATGLVTYATATGSDMAALNWLAWAIGMAIVALLVNRKSKADQKAGTGA